MAVDLHIGLHKTGTSSVQRLLSLHHDTLLRHGVDFPLMGGRPGVAKVHRPFADVLRGIDPVTPEAAALVEAWRPTQPRTIISAEGFSHVAPATIGRVRAVFGDDTHIICALRDPVSHIRSHHIQRSKMMHSTVPLSAFLAARHDEMVREPGGAYYRYDDNIARWRSTFRVSTLTYREDGNMIDDLLDVLGVRDILGDYSAASPRRNTSIHPATAAFARAVARLSGAGKMDAERRQRIGLAVRKESTAIARALGDLTVSETVDVRPFKADFARFNPIWAHLVDGTPDTLESVAGLAAEDEALPGLVAEATGLRL
ncbi:MAG: hypothetical protein EON88_12695 [Brevundimonas sp.]|nr:MAG: hypothetical protein EON88_12695 [Brevundimonas sp.]